MKVGDLVRLKGDLNGVLGMIIEVAPDILTKRTIYLVSWACDMCETAWGESWDLEVINESR